MEYYPTILGSATAGLIARIICHPIDTIKSRLQAGQSAFRSLEGIGALYRGIGAVLIGGVPGVCIYMTSYEMCKEHLSTQPVFKDSPFATYLTAGMIAEATCCVVFVPVDVVKERLQVQVSASTSNAGRTLESSKLAPPVYKGSLDALIQICRQEGLTGIYKGYGATLLSYGPFSALYFFLYEELKKRQASISGSESHDGREGRPLSFIETLSCAAAAGGIASAVTNPLDLAKLRLQIERGSNVSNGKGSEGSGLYGVLKRVYIQDGIRGLFRGAGARVLFHTPCTAITMAVFEECKRRWSQVLSLSEI